MQDHGMILLLEGMVNLGEQNLQGFATVLHEMERWPNFGLCEPCVYKRMKENPYKTLSKRNEYHIE